MAAFMIELPKQFDHALQYFKAKLKQDLEKPFKVNFETDEEMKIYDAIIHVPVQDIQSLSIFLDLVFYFILVMFDNFITLSEVTKNT
jgi:hypothetical protein